MKYNVYSPLGRTGSIRLCRLLHSNAVNTPDFPFSFHENGLPPGQDLHISTHGDKNYYTIADELTLKEILLVKITSTDNGDKENSYVFPELFYDVANKYQVVHSHTCTWAVGDDWTNVLSTRKNKMELPMSLNIAIRSGSWTAGESGKIDDVRRNENTFYSDHPFNLPVMEYIFQLDMLHRKEQLFLEGVKRDTGRDATITYLEESYDELEIKFNLKIDSHWRESLKKKISKRRPKDYILNYDELVDAYNHYEYKG